MASAAPEENLNAHGKESAEITHAERMLSGDDPKQPEEHGLTKAQIRKFMIKTDWRVLPFLGLIYAVSIVDRINVSIYGVKSMMIFQHITHLWRAQTDRF